VRKLGITFSAVAATALVAAGTGSALPKPVPFTGTYAGTASTQVNGTTVAISATGSGKGSIIGAGKVTGTGTGDSSQQPCVPFGGTGTISGRSGSIAFKVTSGANGCGDEGGHVFSVKGYATVTKATGKVAKVKGTLKFTGVYNRDDGTFTVKFTGNLKK